MVDRAARDRVASLIEAFLDDRLTAFEFDDQMMAVETTDETVRMIVGTCWFFYDDCTDHKVVLDKPEWDLIQRLLLILRSDGELLRVPTTRQWGWDNLLAAFCCAAFVIVGILTGWEIHLLLIAVPLGIVSIAISTVRSKREQQVKRDLRIEPFGSVAELMSARKQLRSFRKRPYRGEIRERHIRTRAGQALVWIQARALWLVFSPLILLFQAMPTSRSEPPVWRRNGGTGPAATA